MQDLIRWLNDSFNRKLISLLLILLGVSNLAGGIFSYMFGYDQFLSAVYGIAELQFVSLLASFLVTGILNLIFGVLFLILGFRLYRSIK